MTITPEEQAALERLRINNREYDDPSYLSDSWKIIDLALREHPKGDKCKLSRQELIELCRELWGCRRSMAYGPNATNIILETNPWLK